MNGGLLRALVTWARDAGVHPSLAMVIFLTILVAVALGSAFLSADIAEKRERNRVTHFLLGLLLPWFYPLSFSQFIRAPAQKADLDALEKAREGELPESMIEGVGTGAFNQARRIISDSQEMRITQFDQQTFRTAAFNEFGEARGPFKIDLTDGNSVEVSRILDALDNVLLLELIDEAGKPKKLRIPYEHIVSCVTLSESQNEPDERADTIGYDDTVEVETPEGVQETQRVQTIEETDDDPSRP